MYPTSGSSTLWAWISRRTGAPMSPRPARWARSRSSRSRTRARVSGGCTSASRTSSPRIASRTSSPRASQRAISARTTSPGAVGAGVRAPALGPAGGEVDRSGHERRDGQDADRGYATGQGAEVQPDHRCHPEDDQPQRLGLLAGRDKCLRGPTQRVNEGPHLGDERAEGKDLEEPVERGVSPRHREHDSRLSGPGGTWGRVPIPPVPPGPEACCEHDPYLAFPFPVLLPAAVFLPVAVLLPATALLAAEVFLLTTALLSATVLSPAGAP